MFRNLLDGSAQAMLRFGLLKAENNQIPGSSRAGIGHF
jgi:hypothetical protein